MSDDSTIPVWPICPIVYVGSVCVGGQKRGPARAGRGAQCEQTIQIEAGYRFEFDPNEDTLLLIARMIDAERQCCAFLRFDLSVPPEGAQMSLEVTGPSGTREFLDALLEPA
jgi:hypothetical protein